MVALLEIPSGRVMGCLAGQIQGSSLGAASKEHSWRAVQPYMFVGHMWPAMSSAVAQVVPKDAIELCCDAQGKLMKLGEGYR